LRTLRVPNDLAALLRLRLVATVGNESFGEHGLFSLKT
jgi:hypothetical protein